MVTVPVEKKRSLLMAKWTGSKADEKQDKKTMKGMTPAQKAKFEKADKKMDAKKPSKKEDMKKDAALAARIKGKKK